MFFEAAHNFRYSASCFRRFTLSEPFQGTMSSASQLDTFDFMQTGSYFDMCGKWGRPTVGSDPTSCVTPAVSPTALLRTFRKTHDDVASSLN
jgi:hypothetical protein